MAEMATATGRPVPYDIEAEEAIVAAAMVCPDDELPLLVEAVDPRDFYREANGWIWRAIQDCYAAGEAVNQITVAHRLSQMASDREGLSVLDEVGGQTRLAELVRRLPTSVGAEWYGAIVRRMATYRRLLGAASRISRMAYEAPENVEEVLDRAMELLLGVGRDAPREWTVSAAELVERPGGLAELIEAHIADPRALMGPSTGFPVLDFILRGWARGRVYVFAAETSVGKSLWVQDRALRLAIDGHRVLFFSTEMGNLEVGRRMAFNLAGIDPYAIEYRGGYTTGERAAIREAVEKLHGLPISFCDRGDLSFAYLRSEVRRQRARHGDVDMVVVDHVDMVAGEGRNRTAELEVITKGLKALALDQDVAVLEVSHLSRPTAERQSRTHRLRNSESKGQDADVVMFLEPWELVDGERRLLDGSDARQRLAERNWLCVDLVIEKHRQGKVGRVQLMLDWRVGGRFVPLSEEAAA